MWTQSHTNQPKYYYRIPTPSSKFRPLSSQLQAINKLPASPKTCFIIIILSNYKRLLILIILLISFFSLDFVRVYVWESTASYFSLFCMNSSIFFSVGFTHVHFFLSVLVLMLMWIFSIAEFYLHIFSPLLEYFSVFYIFFFRFSHAEKFQFHQKYI